MIFFFYFKFVSKQQNCCLLQCATLQQKLRFMKINYYSERTTPRINATIDAPSSRTELGKQYLPKIIKFIGNMKENVNLIVKDLQCQCCCRDHFTDILLIFGNKIERLRADRNKFKSMYVEIKAKNDFLVSEMEKQIEKINQENLILYQKFKELQKNSKKHIKTQDSYISQEGVAGQPNLINQFSMAKILKAVQNLSPVGAYQNQKQFQVSPNTPFKKKNQHNQQKSFTLLLSNSINPIRKQQMSYEISDNSKGYDEILDKYDQEYNYIRQKTSKRRTNLDVYDPIVTCDTQSLKDFHQKNLKKHFKDRF